MPTKIVPANKNAAKSLYDLFVDSLKDALWAENAMKDALPKMVKNVHSNSLKKSLQNHLAETKEHIKQLKAIFKSIGVKAEEERCDAMAGILEEGEGLLKDTEPGAVRDAAIIAACQKAEHYEIASYGTMAAFARHLKETEARRILEVILKEEKAADKALTKLAITEINVAADKAALNKNISTKSEVKSAVKKTTNEKRASNKTDSVSKKSVVSKTGTSAAKATKTATTQKVKKSDIKAKPEKKSTPIKRSTSTRPMAGR